MTIKKKALTPDLARKWAGLAHMFFIDALSTSTRLSLDNISFHGGTNLHLSWGSPRYSEDLDFLVTRDFGSQVTDLMPKLEKRMRALAMAEDPDLKVEIRNKTKNPDGLLNFRIVLTSPNIVGQVMAKAEFWQVEADYLKKYDAGFLQQKKPGEIVSRVSQPIPAATLDAAFADKVVALGFRPHLKWRDLFDLWWINNQRQINPVDRLDDIMHHASAYEGPDGMGLAQGLQAFLDRKIEDVMQQADPDLKRWLPKKMWDTLNPDGVRSMVDNARSIAQAVLEELSSRPTENAGKTLETETEDGPDSGP